MYTDGMRRIKHNIQTYYRTRLFWFKNDNDKERKVRNYIAFCYRSIKKHKHKQETKTRYKKSNEKRSSDGFFKWYRTVIINLHNCNSFRLLTVFIKFCTVYIFGVLQSIVGSIEFLSSVKK